MEKLIWYNGYPTEKSLDQAQKKLDELAYQIAIDDKALHKGTELFFSLLQENKYNAYGIEKIVFHGEEITVFAYHTCGWSGNENVISMLKDTLWWRLYWLRSDRGGHYYFNIPPRLKKLKFNEKGAQSA